LISFSWEQYIPFEDNNPSSSFITLPGPEFPSLSIRLSIIIIIIIIIGITTNNNISALLAGYGLALMNPKGGGGGKEADGWSQWKFTMGRETAGGERMLLRPVYLLILQ
jgi:hypothetical protein